MDLTEFGRVVHAEMCAICDAARLGRSIKNATLFCTTFPCHNCAKHIIAAGIKKVVYIEPYAKSRAGNLHENEIAVENETRVDVVHFTHFVGISPHRYRDLFERGRRKDAAGKFQEWAQDVAKPYLGDVITGAYLTAEKPNLGSITGEVLEKPVKLLRKRKPRSRRNKSPSSLPL